MLSDLFLIINCISAQAPRVTHRPPCTIAIALAAARAVKTEANNCFAFKHQGLDTYPSRNSQKPADSGEHGEREHMLPAACIMTPIKAINNCKSDTDISVTVMRRINEAFNI